MNDGRRDKMCTTLLEHVYQCSVLLPFSPANYSMHPCTSLASVSSTSILPRRRSGPLAAHVPQGQLSQFEYQRTSGLPGETRVSTLQCFALPALAFVLLLDSWKAYPALCLPACFKTDVLMGVPPTMGVGKSLLSFAHPVAALGPCVSVEARYV